MEYKENKVYNVGIYVRLSREDEISKKESESITNQKDFLESYVASKGWNIAGVYSDDGYSGTNFDRPAFKEMIKDIEDKKINLVITKDLSRLGRNYSKTGYYIDEFFPEKNVRYIAVNDNVDTLKELNSTTSAFMSVVNDIYAKDISKKVRTAFNTKQKNGIYLGTSAPYGYKKDPVNKGKLIIDPITSENVKRIFRDFLAGKDITRITVELTRDEVVTPSEYAKVKNTQKVLKGAWNARTVRRILKNEVYIGNLIQHKKEKVNYKVKKSINIPENEWIKVENTHEAIIDLNDFKMVKSILDSRSYMPKSGKSHLLTGLLYCAKCGSRVTFLKRYAKNKYYAVCSTAKTFKKIGKCDMCSMYEEDIESKIRCALVQISNSYLDKNKLESQVKLSSFNDEKKQLLEKQLKLKQSIEDNKKVKYELFKEKVEGSIPEEEFKSLSHMSDLEREKNLKRLEEIEKRLDKINNKQEDKEEMMSYIEEILKFEKLDKKILNILIDRIYLYKGPTGEEVFDIRFNFNVGR